MKLGIIGLKNSGKTTLFNALTKVGAPTSSNPYLSAKPNIGVVAVPDERLERLSEIFKPKKTTHATVEYLDSIGVTKGDLEQNKKVFDLIKEADAIVQVVRVFRNEAVAHPAGSIDPVRDIEMMELELVFGDCD